jgi:hypothetical protein
MTGLAGIATDEGAWCVLQAGGRRNLAKQRRTRADGCKPHKNCASGNFPQWQSETFHIKDAFLNLRSDTSRGTSLRRYRQGDRFDFRPSRTENTRLPKPGKRLVREPQILQVSRGKC